MVSNKWEWWNLISKSYIAFSSKKKSRVVHINKADKLMDNENALHPQNRIKEHSENQILTLKEPETGVIQEIIDSNSIKITTVLLIFKFFSNFGGFAQ